MLIAQYTVAQEANLVDATWADVATKLTAQNWWVVKADGTTKLKATYTDPNVYDTNLTDWTTPDDNGLRYPQWLAQRNDTAFFTGGAFDYAFIDNVLRYPSENPADWDLDTINETNSDADVASKYRAGQVAYISALKSFGHVEKVLTNSLNNNDLSADEYKVMFEGAYMEAAIGESWSIESVSGWAAMMLRYRAGLANTKAPHLVGFGTQGTTGEFQTMRYGFTSCLMDNGYFSYVADDSYRGRPAWFDEFDYDYGQAVDGPKVSAWSNGIYKREFAHAVALCNPTGSPQTVTPTGGPWKRIKGLQASAINTGANVTGVTIPSKDGLILLKRSVPTCRKRLLPRSVRQ